MQSGGAPFQTGRHDQNHPGDGADLPEVEVVPRRHEQVETDAPGSRGGSMATAVVKLISKRRNVQLTIPGNAPGSTAWVMTEGHEAPDALKASMVPSSTSSKASEYA